MRDKPERMNTASAGGAGRPESRPVSAIIEDILGHLTEIVRSEILLAREELRRDLSRAFRATLVLMVGAILSLYAFGFILLAAVYALGETLPMWAAALTVGGVGAGLAIIFLVIGRNKFKLVSLVPDQTIESLQENAAWVKRRTR